MSERFLTYIKKKNFLATNIFNLHKERIVSGTEVKTLILSNPIFSSLVGGNSP